MRSQVLEVVNSMAKPTKQEAMRVVDEVKQIAEAAVPVQDKCKVWAYAGVILMAVMSAGLNGYANSQEATVEWAGWAMGIAIPALVLILARVAGLRYRRGQHRLALAGAFAGGSLLILSVWHCATSISLITGSHIMMAVPMAVAIDAGLVYCECCTLD